MIRWLILGGIVVFVLPVAVLAWSLCKVASDADDAVYDWDDIGRRD